MAYFDHNATAPLTAVARSAWLTAQEQAWHNPGGGYRAAARVRALLDRETERLGALLGAKPSRVVATSGATEAAYSVFAHLARCSRPTDRVLVGPTEHSCVKAAAEFHFPGRVEFLVTDSAGRCDPAAIRGRLQSGGVVGVATMAANNETGVLQPWTEIATSCAEFEVPQVCDAVQWVGRLPAHGMASAGYVFGSAHKFGGPKGVGFLLVPEGSADGGFRSLLGGGQQGGRRAGTENWPGVAAMVAALAEAEATLVNGTADRQRWKEAFEAALPEHVPGIRIVGAAAPRLWNTVLAVLPAGDSQRWVTKLDRRGFEVSTTAACAAARGRGSAVLAALGWSPGESRRALRFSSGRETTEADWRGLLAALAAVRAEVGDGFVVG